MKVFVVLVLVLICIPIYAQPVDSKQDNQVKKGDGLVPTQEFFKREDNPQKVVTTLELFFLFTILSLAPAIVVMLTSFTRIVIVLSFVRRALATQELPPNQVITGLSLILTFMVMSPTLNNIKKDALDPYMSTEPSKAISQDTAFRKALGHLRTFMFGQTRLKDIKLFLDIQKTPPKEEIRQEDVPTSVLVPAFVISELRRAFIMGFAIFLPFMIIDMVVASTLISMGMLVLPPILISLPFKILLFILVDGWHLIIGSLVMSFQVP